jgi:tetratricopeptide (TPR) repeat protein
MSCIRMRIVLGIALALCCLDLTRQIALCESSGPTDSDAALERARKHFKIGVDFYRERNFRAALIEFQRAYKSSPHYKLLYNLGQTSLELREDAAAIDYFSRYLQEGRSELEPERRQEVELDLERLRARIATLSVRCNQDGAEIYLDEALIGTSPLREPLKVSVGRRKLVAVKHGLPDAERVIDIAAGEHVSVMLELKPQATQELPSLQLMAAKPEAQSGGISAAGWAGITTGLVAAAAGTLSVLTALSQNAYDVEIKRETTPARLRAKRDDAKTKALVSDVLWGATAVSAGITAIFVLSAGKSDRDPSLAVRLTPGSVRITGQF